MACRMSEVVIDQDTRRLIDEICTHAGMIMEDCSTVAVTTRRLDYAELVDKLGALADDIRNVEVLVDAARCLVRQRVLVFCDRNAVAQIVRWPRPSTSYACDAAFGASTARTRMRRQFAENILSVTFPSPYHFDRSVESNQRA